MSLRFEDKVLPLLDNAYRYAVTLTRSAVEAEDVLQEAMLRAYRSFASLRSDDAKPWLLVIVRNTYFSMRSRHRTAVSLEALQEESTDLNAASRPGPEALAEDADVRRLLGTLLARLSPEHREVLLLREIEDLNYREIAELLGIAEGTVMSRLARARAALKALWSKRNAEAHL